CFSFQAEDGIRGFHVTGVQTCALPISNANLAAAPLLKSVANRMLWRLSIRLLRSIPLVMVLLSTCTAGCYRIALQNGPHDSLPQIGRASCRERGGREQGAARRQYKRRQ